MTVQALRKTGKADALAQLAERPDLAANISAASRLWGVSRSTVRTWIAEYAAMAVPPEPPEPPPAMAEPLPPSPVAVAMVNPLHDFRNLFPPNPVEIPIAAVAATMADERPAMAAPGESALPAVAEPVDTPSFAMAATMAEPAPLVEKPAVPVEWRIVERPVWHPTVIWQAPRKAHAFPVKRPVKRDYTSLLTARILVAAVLFLAALDLGGSGLVMNWRYAASLGSGEGAIIQAMIGVAIDAIALVILSAGYLLWTNGHRRFAVMAWIIWPVMLGLSLMNTIGFSATNISDALARRSATVAEITNKATAASNAASDLKKLRDERDGITEKRTVQAIKLQLVGDRKKVDRIDRDAFDVTVGCTRLTADITSKACDAVLSLVKALAAANRRDELTRKIEKAEAKNSPAEGNEKSTITSVDPQTEAVPKLVAWITRNKIEPTSDDIALVRILGLTVPPCLAGLFFMFATALLAMEKVK